MSDRVVLAVDGGNSKTDLALVRADGEVLGLARGPLSSPHHLGLDGALDVLQRLLDQASRDAGRARDGTVATIAQLLMAGVDFPSEEEELRAAVARRGWAERTRVGNDTFAVLRAGTERGWGVAVVSDQGEVGFRVAAVDGEHGCARHTRLPAVSSKRSTSSSDTASCAISGCVSSALCTSARSSVSAAAAASRS